MSCSEAIAGSVITVLTASIFLQEHGDNLSPVEQAKQDYREGRTDAAEFERRLEFHLDDRNEPIRAAVLPVANVGDDTADALARERASGVGRGVV